MSEDGQTPRLRIFARSHGAENRTNRPDFYDKTTCVASLIVAAETVTPPAELVFVNDGPLPADQERLMATAGEVVQGEFGSNRRSFRSTVAMAAGRAYDEDDVVWFAEDDYLYRPDAFVRLMEAAQRVTQADYFSMYVGELADRRPAAGNAVGLAGDPTSAAPGEGVVDWVPAVSSTSSFAVRVRQLREDTGLLRVMPYIGGAFHQATSLALQNRYPFTCSDLATDLVPFAKVPPSQWLRSVTRGIVRAALGLRALRRPSRRRAFYSPTRDLITRLGVGALDPAEGWESVARQCDEWAAAHKPGTRPPAATPAGRPSL